MVADPARVRVAILAGMLLAGCTVSHDVHPAFAQAYRAARVVAILPPYVQVVELGGGDSPRPDWTFAGFENIAGALQSELEDRGLEVAWISATPDTESLIADVAGSVIAMPSLTQQAEAIGGTSQRRFLEHQQFYLGKAMGPLLDSVGADLLVVVQAGGQVQTTAGWTSEFVGSLISALLFGKDGGGPRSTSSWLRISVADRSGRVVYEGRGSDSRTLMDPDAVEAIVAGALSGLPKPDHRKALGEKCVMPAECQPGLDCPYGRCIQAEQGPRR
jgi:hypothetical protein